MYDSSISPHLVGVLPRDRVQEDAGPDHVLLAVPSPVLGHHHLFAPRPHAVQQPVRAEFVLVVDSFFLGLRKKQKKKGSTLTGDGVNFNFCCVNEPGGGGGMLELLAVLENVD